MDPNQNNQQNPNHTPNQPQQPNQQSSNQTLPPQPPQTASATSPSNPTEPKPGSPSQPPPPNTPNQPTSPPMPKKFPTKWLIIIGAIVLLLLLSAGAYAGYNSFLKPQPTPTPTPQEPTPTPTPSLNSFNGKSTYFEILIPKNLKALTAEVPIEEETINAYRTYRNSSPPKAIERITISRPNTTCEYQKICQGFLINIYTLENPNRINTLEWLNTYDEYPVHISVENNSTREIDAVIDTNSQPLELFAPYASLHYARMGILTNNDKAFVLHYNVYESETSLQNQYIKEIHQILSTFRFLDSEDTSTPQEGEISWEQAVSLVNSCQVDMVFQTHSLSVTLTLKDGETVTTTEPAIDNIFDVVRNTEPYCGTIPIATE